MIILSNYCKMSIYKTQKIFFLLNVIVELVTLVLNLRSAIVHFLPVFGCVGDSAWNCIPTVYW